LRRLLGSLFLALRLNVLADVNWFSASWAKSQRRRSTSSSAALRLS